MPLTSRAPEERTTNKGTLYIKIYMGNARIRLILLQIMKEDILI